MATKLSIECPICKRTDFKVGKSLATHIGRFHKEYTPERYYNTFLRKNKNEGICKECGSQTKFLKPSSGYRTFCGSSCSSKNKDTLKKSEETYFKKTGCTHNSRNTEENKKIKQKNLEKCGAEYFFQSNEFKRKSENTNLERHGVEHYNNIEKIKKTNLERYGTEYFFQGGEFKTKSEETKIKLYGNKNYNNTDKRESTNLERYGVTVPLKNEIIKDKMVETNIKRYGGPTPMHCGQVKIKNAKSKIDNYGGQNFINRANKIHDNKYNYSKSEYILSHSKVIIICIAHGEFLQMPYDHLNGKGCPKCSHSISKQEKALAAFIKSNYSGEIITNSKKIISPLELDIYLPDLKLAFEFNGLYWHSELRKDKNYHLDKTNVVESKGIQLIHIYEDDWNVKQKIVESRILNLLSKSKRIYGRQCIIKEVSFADSKIFLNDNHIQGNCVSKIRHGLYYKNELVSIMTFGKLRKNLGQTPKKGSFELLRFCNKSGYSVIGGASKLLKYFLNQYNPDKIISYADRSWSRGNLYTRLGFDLIHKTPPNYFYIVDDQRENRFKYRKDSLIKQGFSSDKTEHEIMLERELFRIYDSGQLKFEINM